MLELNKIYNEDCIGNKELGTGMWRIPDKSIDMILCDLPYGTTRNKWDSLIPLDKLWNHYERIIKDNGAIVLFGNQPFTSLLVQSNLKLFKYEWIWNKVCGRGFLNAKKQPLRNHESILVFYKKQPKYNPQFEKGESYFRPKPSKKWDGTNDYKLVETKNVSGKRYPKTIITFSNANQKGKIHPTQKPVELFEYLIKTYSDEGDIILDNCMGSGTTAIACLNTNRKYIGFEIEKEYYDLANDRIYKHIHNLK